jgi:Skp family chaperone for outer membrane proteins
LVAGVAAAQSPVTQAPQPGNATMTMAFPAEARVAYVDVDRVAALSVEGKAANARLNDLRAKKAADLEARSKQVQALQAKINQGTDVLNDGARVRLQRDFQRAQIDFQRASEDAQSEVQEAQQETSQAFSARLFPIIGEVAKEKKIWAVFGTESSVLWHDPATDLSEEVAKRLDASAKRP